MSPQFSEFLNGAAIDAVRALPAALARVALGRPHGFLRSALTLIGSLALAVTAGDIARSFQQTKDFAWLVVVAVAFNAQHVFLRADRRYREYLDSIDSQKSGRNKRRSNHHRKHHEPDSD